MAGDVMGHANKIADLMSQELGHRGRAASMKTLPVTASDAHGLWVIRLHRVPSRLQVYAIMQEEGANVLSAYNTFLSSLYCWRLDRTSCDGLEVISYCII